MTIESRALALVRDHPEGLTAKGAGELLAVGHALASMALGRLFWKGQVDRRLSDEARGIGWHYIYTPHGDTPEAALPD